MSPHPRFAREFTHQPKSLDLLLEAYVDAESTGRGDDRTVESGP
jgi:hypothetical protein